MQRRVSVMCLYVFGANNEEGTGQNNNTAPSTNSNLDIHHLWLLIRLLSMIFVFPFKVIDVISFRNPA